MSKLVCLNNWIKFMKTWLIKSVFSFFFWIDFYYFPPFYSNLITFNITNNEIFLISSIKTYFVICLSYQYMIPNFLLFIINLLLHEICTWQNTEKKTIVYLLKNILLIFLRIYCRRAKTKKDQPSRVLRPRRTEPDHSHP